MLAIILRVNAAVPNEGQYNICLTISCSGNAPARPEINVSQLLKDYGGGGQPGRVPADVLEQLRLAAEPAVDKGRGYTRKLYAGKFLHNSRKVEGRVDPDPAPATARAELVPDPDPEPLEVVQPDPALLPAALEVVPGPELVAAVPQDQAPELAGPDEVLDQEQEGAAADPVPALAPARADNTTAEEVAMVADPVPDPAPLENVVPRQYIAQHVLEVLDDRRQLRAYRELGQRAEEYLK